MEKKEGVQDIADKVLKANKTQRQGRQFMLWILALVVGAALGWLGIKPLNELFTFIATVFTRLFQFIAVPTIALAVITTLAALGGNKNTGRILLMLLLIRSSLHSVQPASDLPCSSGLHREIFLLM